MYTIIGKAEAKAAGLKNYFTGEPCPKGHIALRYLNSSKCQKCNSERCAKRREDKSEEVKAEKRRWHAENRDRISAERKAKYQENPDAAKERARRRYAEDAEKVLAGNKKSRVKNWQKILESRRSRHSAEQSARKAAQIQRMPGWLTEKDREVIKARYAEARWMTIRTGVGHVVDHFYPLQGKYVSGLHVPSNLRVIPARENNKKQAKLPTVERTPI
jgi:hypothetical protein